MKIRLIHAVIFTLFLLVCGLFYYVYTKPYEVFVEKSQDEAYVTWVSHTEYIAGDSTGQAIVSVTDYMGRPLNASCNLSLLYPNKTFVFTDLPMSPSVIAGNYYRVFTVPNTFGIYVEFVNCSVVLRPNTNVTASKSNSIHVNPAFDFLVNISQNLTRIEQKIDNLSIDMQNNFTNIENLLNNLSVNMNNNFTFWGNNMTWNFNYTNELIKNASQNCTANITSFRNEAYTWYVILRQDIYNMYQRWIDEIDRLLTDAFGLGQIIQRVPTGGGATQQEKSWLDRILGR